MQDWLESIPPGGVYLALVLIVGLEFLCLPLPAGVALITASLLSAGGHVSPWLVVLSTVLGVVAGSALGYRLGRRGGKTLLDKLSRRFPQALSEPNIAKVTGAVERWGVWAVVVSCFTALLRMVTAPLAGTLALPFGRFLLAMGISAVAWAGSTTAAIYAVGLVAQEWLDLFNLISLGMLAVALVFGAFTAWRRRLARRQSQ